MSRRWKLTKKLVFNKGNDMGERISILNGYCGVGGNRLLWPDDQVEVTAIDTHAGALECYAHYNPNDTIVQGDCEQYVLDNYDKYDLIWLSPPCQTESMMMVGSRHWMA
jgi:site-specific DNA-cytosine methylase